MNCPSLPTLFHRVKGHVKDVAVNMTVRIGNAIDRAAHRVDKGGVDYVAGRAVLMALASLLISPFNPRLHSGLDVDHRFPKGFSDHLFHNTVAR
jgi:hypothetical protein